MTDVMTASINRYHKAAFPLLILLNLLVLSGRILFV